jgi:hypothetical protein
MFTYLKTDVHGHIFHNNFNDTFLVGAELNMSVEEATVYVNTKSNTVASELTYREKRAQEYAKRGLTTERFALALIQFNIDGDSTDIDQFIAERKAVKQQFPKQ